MNHQRRRDLKKLRTDRRNALLYRLIFKMYHRLKIYGLMTGTINRDFKLITRDYKQSLVKELEDITQKESLMESNIQEIKDN